MTDPRDLDLVLCLRNPTMNAQVIGNGGAYQAVMDEASARQAMNEAATEIERLMAELAEWKQAASVEAGLRREFLARAEKAEAEREHLQRLAGAVSTGETFQEIREKAKQL